MIAKKGLVIGAGISGKATAFFLLRQGWQVLLYDDQMRKKKSLDWIDSFQKSGGELVFDWASVNVGVLDHLIISPSIKNTHPLVTKAASFHVPIDTEMGWASRKIRGYCIGITGTNGKTTVTEMITHVLKATGYPAVAVGNIGIPLIEALDYPEEWIKVIEMSSFQLSHMQDSFLDQALVLNITPDHLDWHGSMDDYVEAKLRIEKCLKKTGSWAVSSRVYDAFSEQISDKKPSVFVSGLQKNIYPEEVSAESLGIYSEMTSLSDCQKENVTGGYLVCNHLNISKKDFFHAYGSYCMGPHRLEFVRQVKGVDFINDSKATNPDAVISAVRTLTQKIILIAGGEVKGLNYGVWKKHFHNKVIRVLAIGVGAQKIREDLGESIPVEIFKDLREAVLYACRVAVPGNQVLLSPGGASLDMFHNYAHRGEVFKSIVNGLDNQEVKK